MRGDGQVYTPQVVVNGSVHALGSDKAAIEHAIKQSRQNAVTLSLPVTLPSRDGRVSVSAPDGAPPPRGSVEVWLCALAKAVTVAIGRGENNGRTITYHNVLRRWVKLGDWTGKANAWSVPLQALKRRRHRWRRGARAGRHRREAAARCSAPRLPTQSI